MQVRSHAEHANPQQYRKPEPPRTPGTAELPSDMQSLSLSACLPGRAFPAGGVSGAAETTLWREAGLLGGLLLMIVSQTLGGG